MESKNRFGGRGELKWWVRGDWCGGGEGNEWCVGWRARADLVGEEIKCGR